MVKILTTLTLMFALSNAYAAEVELEAGQQFQSVYLSGTVGLWCPNNRLQDSKVSYQLVNCRANVLNPAEFTKARYNGGLEADEISISVTQSTGKRVTKSSRLKNGVSTKQFNLWIRTLFQRPLLDYGINQVEYSVTNDNSLVAAGTFDVEVDTLPDRQCRHRTYSSPFPSDCNNSLSICDRYFRDENYCN